MSRNMFLIRKLLACIFLVSVVRKAYAQSAQLIKASGQAVSGGVEKLFGGIMKIVPNDGMFDYTPWPTPVPTPLPPITAIPTPMPKRYVRSRTCISNPYTNWTYNSECMIFVKDHQLNPTKWHLLHPLCGGERQSPINVEVNLVSSDCDSAPVRGLISYNRGTCTYGNLDIDPKIYSWRIGFPKGACGQMPSITISGVTYTLQEFEFHTMAEHAIEAFHDDAELQMKHVNAKDPNDVLIVAVMLRVYLPIAGYSTIDDFWGRLTHKAAKLDKVRKKFDREISPDTSIVDPYMFLPDHGVYFTYMGSLTKPPCTENVKWVIYRTPYVISFLDLDHFRDAVVEQKFTLVDRMGYNNRPIQPKNNRTIHICLLNVTAEANATFLTKI